MSTSAFGTVSLPSSRIFSLSFNMSEQHNVSVAVIGAGAAGLGAAWLLARNGYQVHVFEANSHAGGHAHTIDLPIPNHPARATIPVDVGFIVYNTQTYPDIVSLFQLLKVQEENSCMSFSASVKIPSSNRLFEWGSDSLSTLFADRTNLYRPSMYTMLRDMQRFNNAVHQFVQQLETNQSFPDANISLGEFLHRGAYSSIFIKSYLIPMVSAVWSASFNTALLFPARSLFHFFVNHGLAQVFARPQWRTPAKRSRDYVTKMVNDICKHNGVVRLATPVTKVQRTETEVIVYAKDMTPMTFDQVIFATHAPATLDILGDDATDEERDILGAFKYAKNIGHIHYDPKLMPTNKAVWSSWNFIGRGRSSEEINDQGDKSSENDEEHSDDPVCVSYWLNRLQNYRKHHIPIPNLFLTLNPTIPIDPDKKLASVVYEHPQFTEEAVKAQPLLQNSLQGKTRSWFCGAYTRYGFHEDAMMSGLDVAEKLSGYTIKRPWKQKQALVLNDNSKLYQMSSSPEKTTLLVFFITLLVLNAVMARLRVGLGKIAVRMGESDPEVLVAAGNGQLIRFGPQRRSKKLSLTQLPYSADSPRPEIVDLREKARVTVKNPRLFARITEALRNDQELAPIAASAFAAFEFDCPTLSELTIALKVLFIADDLDRDPTVARKGRAKFAESLLLSLVGGIQKVNMIPSHNGLQELTTCICNVVYPAWWLQLDSTIEDEDEKKETNVSQTSNETSSEAMSTPIRILEILGDLSESTVSLLKKNEESTAQVVVRTPERIAFVNRKADLLFIRKQIDLSLLDDFLKQRDHQNQSVIGNGYDELGYDRILSPSLANIFSGSGFKSFTEVLTFLSSLGTRSAKIELGMTVFGSQNPKPRKNKKIRSDSMFCGDEGYYIWKTAELLKILEEQSYIVQNVSFMDSQEAALDVRDITQRVYDTLVPDKLNMAESRAAVSQLCLWEAALQVKYLRRMAVSFTKS